MAPALRPGALITGAAFAAACHAGGPPPSADAASACQSCHGAVGEGNAQAGYPRLAALPSAYLQRQLEAFAQGERKSGIMGPIAKALSPADRSAVSDHYAASPVPLTARRGAVAQPSSAGALLATRGRWSDGLPACEQCHAPGGRGVGTDFPPLAGQPSAYIVAQLKAWREGTRPPGPMGLMAVIAKKLSDDDAQQVAVYFAAQPASPAVPQAGAKR